MPEATITEVRESPYGMTCGVEVDLTVNGRHARTRISWHFAVEIAAPILEFHTPDIAMLEILEPELGPAARIVFAPLDKLRIVKQAAKSS
jgi:hypothetical protein